MSTSTHPSGVSNYLSRGCAVAARSSRRCCRFDWFSLTWTMRSLPVALAISNVFLTGHGVDREDAAGQAERLDEGLDGWDLVRLLLNDFMSQDDPMIDGKSAQHMRRLSVREGIKAAPERLRAASCRRSRRSAMVSLR